MSIIDNSPFCSQCCLSIVIQSANFQMYDLIDFRRIIVILALPFHFPSSFFCPLYKIKSRYPNCAVIITLPIMLSRKNCKILFLLILSIIFQKCSTNFGLIFSYQPFKKRTLEHTHIEIIRIIYVGTKSIHACYSVR